jgi:hypothetical protein
MRSRTPRVEKKVRALELSNSRPLSHSGPELCGHIRKEISKCAKRVRFESKRESPQIMCVIIKYNQVILIARYTGDWRCPQITMYKIKPTQSSRRRNPKR